MTVSKFKKTYPVIAIEATASASSPPVPRAAAEHALSARPVQDPPPGRRRRCLLPGGCAPAGGLGVASARAGRVLGAEAVQQGGLGLPAEVGDRTNVARSEPPDPERVP